MDDVLLERESEAATLRAVISAASAGRGGAVLIEGEAGIGKTRLLTLAREHAAVAGVNVLYATADETEASAPLAGARVLLRRAARDMAPDGPARLGVLALDGALADPSGPGSRADEVVHALWWVVVELADQQPLVLIVDDAQWADPLTLRLLRMIARRADQAALALIVAARPPAPGGPHAMLGAERAFTRLEPAPLSPAGTDRLLTQALGEPEPDTIVAQAREMTGGNPLYLRELALHVRSGGGDVFVGGRSPPQLVRLIGDRLARLTPHAAALAEAVAILGADADRTRARELAGLDASAAIAAEEELRVEHVLDAGGYRFLHPLIAAAVREGIGAIHASELHAHAAALLDRDGVDEPRVAEHLAIAAPRADPAIVATLRRAAEAARRVGAPATAARLLERAMAEPPPDELVDALAFEHGRALLDCGSEQGGPALARVVQTRRDLSARVDAGRLLAHHHATEGRAAEAVVVLQSVLETLNETQGEIRLELLAEAALAGSSVRGGRAAAQRSIASDAARVTGRTPAERLLLVAAHVVSGEAPTDPAGAARQVLALRLYRDFPSGFAAAELTFAAMVLLVNADALEDAERAMDTLRADAESLALPRMIAGAHWQQAQIAYQRGDLARCEVEAEAASEAGGDFSGRLAMPWRVMALAEQNRVDEAERLLDVAGLLDAIGRSGLLHAAVGSRGRLRLAQGDFPAAIEDLTDARDRSAAWYPQRTEPPWQPLLAEALALADRRAEAAAEADAFAPLAEYWGTRRAMGHLARMRALVAPRAGAIELLEEACGHFAASPARLELARSMTELGTHRRAAGERRAARALLRDAHDLAYACGADALCDRARAELLLAGGRPRPLAGAGAGALTPGERRVAEIAAQGASNREIARRLYLSPKTVEMHLRSAYRKLDLAGREGLAAALG